jgi:hypothetical protein
VVPTLQPWHHCSQVGQHAARHPAKLRALVAQILEMA